MYVIDRTTGSVILIPASTPVVNVKDARRTIRQNGDTLNQIDRQH